MRRFQCGQVFDLTLEFGQFPLRHAGRVFDLAIIRIGRMGGFPRQVTSET